MRNFTSTTSLGQTASGKPVKRSVKIAAWLLSALILCTVLELGSYFIYASKLPYVYDEDMGWVLKPDYQAVFNTESADGLRYRSQLTTDVHGFRAWGNLRTHKKKLLIIGDSFTGHPYTSDDQAYFSVAARQLDAEVFAGGAGGYGTLQELILLEKYVHEIDPDIFVLQFCSNDFSDNDYEIGKDSFVRNQVNFRPYLNQGKIGQNDRYFYRMLYRSSYFFRLMDIAIQKAQVSYFHGYSAHPVDPASSRFKQEPYKVTAQLMKKMKQSLPQKTRAFTINCDTRTQPLSDYWIEISSNAGFTPLPEVSQTVENQEANGQIVRVKDGGHWNILGNAIAGKALSKRISLQDTTGSVNK